MLAVRDSRQETARARPRGRQGGEHLRRGDRRCVFPIDPQVRGRAPGTDERSRGATSTPIGPVTLRSRTRPPVTSIPLCFAADGNAAKAGLVSVGDQLLSTSALVFNSSSDYGGVSVKKGEETIKFAVRGEKFDTVMAAIGSNPSQRLVTLEFQKCI